MNVNNETTGLEVNSEETEMSKEEWAELIKAVYDNGLAALRIQYNDVEAQVSNFHDYGPVFIFHVKDESGSRYSCGFFLHELLNRFQSDNDPAVWMSSFFVELMETKGGKPLPKPATNEAEAKAIIDNILVPECIKAVTEEFAAEQVHAGLAWKEDHGPVFEAGFPALTGGNNICAISLHFLLIHLQLNRDPGDLLIQEMYNIRKEHGIG
ncbi:hypothetical protein AB4Z45_11570 [Paenibacillus sp. MCAF9]|uniref:hypothetical protein n=1 Tax=Paenibacillus sp. MCAF9 TaxID=3233046 RepID=UPI003F9DEE0D